MTTESFKPVVKQPGDLARSEEWNDAMDEIVRLEDDKVNKAGDTIAGRLTINTGSDVTLGGGGDLVLGKTTGLNLAMDGNEILARKNGKVSTLHLQMEGGSINIHNNKPDSEKIIITNSGSMGIGTKTIEAKLHVNGNILSTGYGAKLMCHRLMTAAWLNEHAAFYSARPHSFKNDRLDFAQGSEHDEKLFSVPLVPANTLTNNRTYTVRIAVSATNIAEDRDDNDLTVGISDGTNVVSFLRADSVQPDTDGFGVCRAGTDGNKLGNIKAGPWGPWGTLPKTTYQWFEILIRLDNTTWISGKVNSNLAPAVWTADRTIQRKNALSLVAFGNNKEEQYGIYSVEVSIMAESPVPTKLSQNIGMVDGDMVIGDVLTDDMVIGDIAIAKP